MGDLSRSDPPQPAQLVRPLLPRNPRRIPLRRRSLMARRKTAPRETSLLPRPALARTASVVTRSEEHTSELQSRGHLVCRLLLEKKKKETEQIHERVNRNRR